MNLGLSARNFQQFGHDFRRMSAVPEFGQQHTLDLRALRTAIQRADADECIVRKHTKRQPQQRREPARRAEICLRLLGVNVLPMFIRMTCSFKTGWVNGAKSLSDSLLLKQFAFAIIDLLSVGSADPPSFPTRAGSPPNAQP